jgi:tetratricopeptide (TPR) repeat protein
MIPSSLRFRLRTLLLAIGSVLPLAAGTWLVIGRVIRPAPSLDEVCALAQAHRFDDAEVRGEAYLRRFPDDPQALLVMAELALARPTPDPQRALARLARISPLPPALAAWVLVNQGNAHYLLARFDQAEACWNAALKHDATVGEAGRRLLDLYTLQGRRAEARALALDRFDREPDARERVRLLLRLARLDVDPPEPWLIINRFEPAIRSQTADLPSTLACGLALTSVSRSQDGLPLLREAVQRHPDDPTAWDALMTGLELAIQESDLHHVFNRLPDKLRADPRFAKHQGRAEQAAGRWSEAVRAFRRAWEFEPDYTVGYRLGRAQAIIASDALATAFEQRVHAYHKAFVQARGLLQSADAALRDGRPLPARLAERMADVRARMGQIDEARAWRRLDASSAPSDTGSSAQAQAVVGRSAVP